MEDALLRSIVDAIQPGVVLPPVPRLLADGTRDEAQQADYIRRLDDLAWALPELGGGYRMGIGTIIRPVAIPDDVDDPNMPKASGKVTLPLEVWWSEPFDRVWDLDDPAARRSLYAQVLTEGGPDHVRYYIDIRLLVEMWDHMTLSDHVRPLWDRWLHQRGYLPRC